jgi:hypothetical protein
MEGYIPAHSYCGDPSPALTPERKGYQPISTSTRAGIGNCNEFIVAQNAVQVPSILIEGDERNTSQTLGRR